MDSNEQDRKPIFAKCHSERSEESYTLKVYEVPEVRFFAYAQNDSDNAASEFPNLLNNKERGIVYDDM